MMHEKLFILLEKYGSISEVEKDALKMLVTPLKVKRKQILIEKNSPCNKAFFVTKGLLRAYYIDDKGKEITRMFAWENRFITNINSFKGFSENNETIECVKDAEILCIKNTDFETLLSSTIKLKSIYTDILEEYTAMYTKRFEALNTFDLNKKFQYLRQDFPHLIKELPDNLLASFLGISRVHFVNNKQLLYKS